LLVPPVLHQIGFHIKWYWFKNGKPKWQDHAFGVPTCSVLFPFKMLPTAMIFSQYFAMKLLPLAFISQNNFSINET
jgi:hypothetical protein